VARFNFLFGEMDLTELGREVVFPETPRVR
jgi:hypothetical protein